MLAVYALGMAVPLFLMAAVWDRFDLGRRSWLRGWEFSIGHLRVHTTNLTSGVMFVLLGVVFAAYEGTSALSGFYEENGAVDLAYAAEEWANSFAKSIPDVLALAVAFATALFIAVAAYRQRRHGPRTLNDTNHSVEEAEGRRQRDRAKR